MALAYKIHLIKVTVHGLTDIASILVLGCLTYLPKFICHSVMLLMK